MASKKKTEEARSESTLAAAVAGIDREALAPKTRLYALAKQGGRGLQGAGGSVRTYGN